MTKTKRSGVVLSEEEASQIRGKRKKKGRPLIQTLTTTVRLSQATKDSLQAFSELRNRSVSDLFRTFAELLDEVRKAEESTGAGYIAVLDGKGAMVLKTRI